MCSYCGSRWNSRMLFNGKLEDATEMQIQIYPKNKLLSVFLNSSVEQEIKINYCPICGRKLI